MLILIGCVPTAPWSTGVSNPRRIARSVRVPQAVVLLGCSGDGAARARPSIVAKRHRAPVPTVKNTNGYSGGVAHRARCHRYRFGCGLDSQGRRADSSEECYNPGVYGPSPVAESNRPPGRQTVTHDVKSVAGEPPSSQTKVTYRQSGAIAPVLADSDPHFWLDNKGSKPLSGLEYFWKIPNGRKA